jgi:hypothetical protein
MLQNPLRMRPIPSESGGPSNCLREKQSLQAAPLRRSFHEVPPPRRHVTVTTGPCAANGR